MSVVRTFTIWLLVALAAITLAVLIVVTLFLVSVGGALGREPLGSGPILRIAFAIVSCVGAAVLLWVLLRAARKSRKELR